MIVYRNPDPPTNTIKNEVTICLKLLKLHVIILIAENVQYIKSNKFIQHKTFTTMFIAYKQNKHENITFRHINTTLI